MSHSRTTLIATVLIVLISIAALISSLFGFGVLRHEIQVLIALMLVGLLPWVIKGKRWAISLERILLWVAFVLLAFLALPERDRDVSPIAPLSMTIILARCVVLETYLLVIIFFLHKLERHDHE